MKEKLQKAGTLLAQAKASDITVGLLVAVISLIDECLREIHQKEQEQDVG